MTIRELCKIIGLEIETERKVLSFCEEFDFQKVDGYLKDFQDIDKMNSAGENLQESLGDDPDHIKILSCQLKAAVDIYDFYREKGIDDGIYAATMKCFTRFMGETWRMTGKHYFDREWWTVRQIGGHLFRIGELEYEITKMEGAAVISMHIPSDADFSPQACDRSLALAGEFFEKYFPQFKDCEYVCESWLLAPELKKLLKADSNILNFQNRFDVTAEGSCGFDFLEWVYETKSRDFSALPEKTGLQKRMKEYLLQGGMLSNAAGILKSKMKK